MASTASSITNGVRAKIRTSSRAWVGRNARDFDVLAETLSPTHRVLAVDMPGRGNSDWLADPNDYVFPVYLSTLTALVARSGAETVSWVGTSMGGLLGIVMAAQPRSPLARLVVNDVGPVIEPASLARIADYFGKDPTFASFAEIERYLREISAPFGPLTDAQWTYLTQTNRGSGLMGAGGPYDPGIAVPFRRQGRRWRYGSVERSNVRRWSCGARNPTCRCATVDEWRRAAAAACDEIEGVGHARVLDARTGRSGCGVSAREPAVLGTRSVSIGRDDIIKMPCSA
jgi:pimeloyl-ACP methyl ester carboxylesterase